MGSDPGYACDMDLNRRGFIGTAAAFAAARLAPNTPELPDNLPIDLPTPTGSHRYFYPQQHDIDEALRRATLEAQRAPAYSYYSVDEDGAYGPTVKLWPGPETFALGRNIEFVQVAPAELDRLLAQHRAVTDEEIERSYYRNVAVSLDASRQGKAWHCLTSSSD